MRSIRLFSKLIGPPPSLQNLLLRINEAANGLALHQEQQAVSEEVAAHFESLKSLEPFVMTRMHEFENRQLLTVLQHFSSTGIGSEELLATIQRNVLKRVHSFKVQELANAAFYFSRSKAPKQFLSVVENILLKDPLQLDEKSAALIAASFGYAKAGSDELYRVLGGIFAAKSKLIEGKYVAMFCVGFSNKPWKDVSFETALDAWTSQHYDGESPKLQTEILVAMMKYNPTSPLLQRLLLQLKFQELTASQCEKLLAGIAVYSPSLESTALLNRAYELIESSDLTTIELVHFINTLNRHDGTQRHFQALTQLVKRHATIFTSEELTSVLVALITTGRGTPEVTRLLGEQAESMLFSAEQLVRVISAMATANVFVPQLEAFVTKFGELVQGHSLSPAEYTWGLMALSYIKYPGPWNSILDGLKWVAVESPEHYMQLYKAAELVPDSSRHLSIFAERFEK